VAGLVAAEGGWPPCPPTQGYRRPSGACLLLSLAPALPRGVDGAGAKVAGTTDVVARGRLLGDGATGVMYVGYVGENTKCFWGGSGP
jgi:hypothetical protein